MSELSKKVLQILQADFGNSSFIKQELISKGFSGAAASAAIKELEENGYIYEAEKYVNGTPVYSLL